MAYIQTILLDLIDIKLLCHISLKINKCFLSIFVLTTAVMVYISHGSMGYPFGQR